MFWADRDLLGCNHPSWPTKIPKQRLRRFTENRFRYFHVTSTGRVSFTEGPTLGFNQWLHDNGERNLMVAPDHSIPHLRCTSSKKCIIGTKVGTCFLGCRRSQRLRITSCGHGRSMRPWVARLQMLGDGNGSTYAECDSWHSKTLSHRKSRKKKIDRQQKMKRSNLH